MLGTWLWMALVLFPGTFPNNCDVLSGWHFHIRVTSSPMSALVFMSQMVVYTIQLNVPFHMHIENEVTEFLACTASATGTVWHMEPRFFGLSFHHFV